MDVDVFKKMRSIDSDKISREELLKMLKDQDELLVMLTNEIKLKAKYNLAMFAVIKLMQEKGITSYAITKEDCETSMALSVERRDDALVFELVDIEPNII